MNCRFCDNKLEHNFLDLGYAPPSNAYLNKQDLCKPELHYPLKVFVCDECWLVQTQDFARSDELFTNDYAYFSSVSSSWLAHAAAYCEKITKRLALDSNSFVVEIASNDGYLLRNFVEQGVPCLGIEPTRATAVKAEELGIPVLSEFFGRHLAGQLKSRGQLADLIIGNNVYAHVPYINDFTAGMKQILKPGGTITLEFPHLMNLLKYNQFDTVYHEHFSYLSLHTVCRIFEAHGLKVYDVEELPTHGGSLRVYGCHDHDERVIQKNVSEVRGAEMNEGMLDLDVYTAFQLNANKVKDSLLSFLLESRKRNETVVAYGAAAKGNTLLNYGGVRPDLLPVVFDAAPSKQGKFMPGSHIPIMPVESLENYKPDWVIIFPWNISKEILEQQDKLRINGVRFIVCIPEFTILN